MKVPDASLQFAQQVGIQERALDRPDTAASTDSRFCELVKRQSKFAFQVAHPLLRNKVDSEDVVQEVFLKLYRNGSWRNILDEKAFLARATWRIAATRWQKGRREMGVPDLPGSAALDPETSAISEDWLRQVHGMIDSLPEELRQPLALSALDEMNSPKSGE